MSSCAEQTFSGVTPSAWNCLVQQAKGIGINISGNSGEASKSGFTVNWNYDPSTGTLKLRCTDKPWLVPCSIVNGKMRDYVGACVKQ